jgi:molybdate transport system substrate-binding protein
VRRRRAASALVGLGGLVGLVGLVGCAATAGAGAPDDAELVVLAAASLTDVVTELADRLEADRPGLRVTTSYAGSGELAQQVLAGAPADVLVTASPSTMALVHDAGLTAAEPTPVARNSLVLAVPAGNPGDVTDLADLADPALVVALCEAQVPCGALAQDLLARVGVEPAPDTLEQDVRGVLTRLRLDEVDAGLVYRTDVLTAGDEVQVVELVGQQAAQAELVATRYLAAPLTGSGDSESAAAFVDLLRSERGRQVLGDAGFDAP